MKLLGQLFEILRPVGERATSLKLLASVTPSNAVSNGLNHREHAGYLRLDIPEQPVMFMQPTMVTNLGESMPIPACCVQGAEIDYAGG